MHNLSLTTVVPHNIITLPLGVLCQMKAHTIANYLINIAQSGGKTLPKNALDMTLNNLVVKFQ